MNGEERLVHRLHRVAGADVAAVDDLLAERLEHGAHALEDRRVAADHDGQRPLLRADHAAAHRRVDEVDAVCGEPRRAMRARRRRVAGRAVDERRAAFQAGEQTVGSVEQRLDVGRRRRSR